MIRKLIEFGLSDKEASVYLALMELGTAGVTEIARRARVMRTNTYHLLNALMSYGLISLSDDEKKALYSVEPPDRLLFMLKKKVADSERFLKEAEEMMPELKSVYHDPEKPLHVRYYDGVDGIITAYEDTLTAKTKILAYTSIEDAHAFFPGYIPEYYERRTVKGIQVDCLLADSGESRRIKALDKKHLRATKIVPERFKISPEINIYDDKIAIMSLKEKFGVIIESREVVDAFRKMFVLAYERAAQYDKEIVERRKRRNVLTSSPEIL
ncbi:MAG: helix-turn-helix domain-containing protein [Candidatus Gracilibacteria bacterium]